MRVGSTVAGDRIRLRPALLSVAGSIILLPICGSVNAQQAAPPGWRKLGTPPTVGYQNPEVPQEVVMLLGPLARVQPTIEREAVEIATGLKASLGCGDFDAATIRVTSDRVAFLRSRDNGCTVAVRFEPDERSRATIIRGDLTGPSNDIFKRALAWVGSPSDTVAPAFKAIPPSATTTDRAGGAPARPSAAGDEEVALTAAIAAVPAEARPVHIVLDGSGSFSGWPATYVYVVTTYLLFGNGWATRCSDWDPGLLRPTPESLGAAYPDCGLRRWRRSGASVELQDEEGSWSKPTGVIGELRSFKPGERINIDFGNVGGTGFAGAPGGVSTSMLSGSDLRMSSDGRIAVGGWSSVALSGATVGGGSSSRSQPKIGNYRLDGNIIAIRDATGSISRGFIAGVPVTGQAQHIYLNGKQFWSKDD